MLLRTRNRQFGLQWPPMSLCEELTAGIEKLHGVERCRSRFSGAIAFRLGRREIAHFHGDEVLDIRVTLRTGSGWLEFRFTSGRALARALALVREALDANRE
jgi:hypothetical protein